MITIKKMQQSDILKNKNHGTIPKTMRRRRGYLSARTTDSGVYQWVLRIGITRKEITGLQGVGYLNLLRESQSHA